LFGRNLGNYAKGRDLYDLMWYLSDPNWPEPNLVLLGNALIQTHWAGSVPDRDNWREMIYERLKLLDWNMALADVSPFLERPSEIDLLTIASFGRLLRQTD
jgi:hypothetical protein